MTRTSSFGACKSMFEVAGWTSRLEEELAFVEGSLQKACEYIAAFRDACEQEFWGEAWDLFQWLRSTYLALPPLAAHIQGALDRFDEIPHETVLELNARLRRSLDRMQALGETVQNAEKLLGRAAHEPG